MMFRDSGFREGFQVQGSGVQGVRLRDCGWFGARGGSLGDWKRQ